MIRPYNALASLAAVLIMIRAGTGAAGEPGADLEPSALPPAPPDRSEAPERRIAELKSALKNSQATANALQRALENQEDERAAAEAAAKRTGDELAALRKKTAELDKRLRDERAESIADKERMMDEADRRAASLAAERDALKKEVAEVGAAVPEKDRLIEALSAQVRFLQKEIVELRESVRAGKNEIKAARDDATRAEAEKDVEIAAMRAELERSAETQSRLRRKLAATAAAGSAAGPGADKAGRMPALEGDPPGAGNDKRAELKVTELLKKTKEEVKGAPADEMP
jgi:chromosome segregation ATPase